MHASQLLLLGGVALTLVLSSCGGAEGTEETAGAGGSTEATGGGEAGGGGVLGDGKAATEDEPSTESNGQGQPATKASSAKEGSLSKAVFLKKGNDICVETEAEINRKYEKFSARYVAGKNPSQAILNRGAEEIVIPARSKQVQRLRSVGAPKGDGQRVGEVLAAFEAGIEEGRANAKALRGLDGFAFAEAFTLAQEYGLSDCGY